MGPVIVSQASPSASREFASTSPSAVSPAGVSSAQNAQHPSSPPEDVSVNMLHVEFVHNLCSEATKAFDRPDSFTGVSFYDILGYGLNAPYLMNELLSLSALHLSIIKPAKRGFYQHHSTQLQNYALSSFNALSSHITDENTVPIFLFAGVLGLHKLCETLVYRDDDFEVFLDQFVQYCVLHRGVRIVAGQGRWQLLQQTNLKPLLDLGNEIPSLDSTLGPICQELSDRIKGLAFDDSTTNVYLQATGAVQSVISVMEGRAAGANNVDVLMAWSVLVPDGFVTLMSERQEVALVIFAYYGALIHKYRDQWVFCDGGEYLINSISEYLGSQWEEWLRWPRQSLADTNHGNE